MFNNYISVFIIFVFSVGLHASENSVISISLEKLLTPLTKQEKSVIEDVIDDYPEDIIYDCINAGLPGTWNTVLKICEVKHVICKDTIKVLCNPKFYGENVCAQKENYNHKKCYQAAGITPNNDNALFKKMYKKDQGKFDDEELEQLTEICMMNDNTIIGKECVDFFAWSGTIIFHYEDIEAATPVGPKIEIPIHYGENIHEDDASLNEKTNNKNLIQVQRNDKIKPLETVFSTVKSGISSTSTTKTLDGYEAHEHILVKIDNGDKKRSYLILKRDYSILIDSDLKNISYGKSLSVYDPLLEMNFDLTSKEIIPLTANLEQCLDIIQHFFQNKINLKDKKWQDFLKMQSELTLKRLAWSYLEGMQNTDSLEERILELIKDKLNNPKWNNDENNKKLSETYSDKFNALPRNKTGNRNFLAMSTSLLTDIIRDQEAKKKNKKMRPFSLKVSDVLMLEILANSQKMQITNFAEIINSKYTNLSQTDRTLNNNDILSSLEDISKKFNMTLKEVVSKECIEKENLHCKTNVTKKSILNHFMKEVDQISARAISGIMQRLDLDEDINL